jgi:hypothetical protein
MDDVAMGGEYLFSMVLFDLEVRVLVIVPRVEDKEVEGGAGGLSGGDWNMEQLRASHGGTTTTTRSKKNTVTFMFPVSPSNLCLIFFPFYLILSISHLYF